MSAQRHVKHDIFPYLVLYQGLQDLFLLFYFFCQHYQMCKGCHLNTKKENVLYRRVEIYEELSQQHE